MFYMATYKFIVKHNVLFNGYAIRTSFVKIEDTFKILLILLIFLLSTCIMGTR